MVSHWTIKLDKKKWKTAPLAKGQLCEYANQTLEAFVVVGCLYGKFDCPVALQNLSHLTAAHDCETGLCSIVTADQSQTSPFNL